MGSSAKSKKQKPHTLIGSWVNGDEYATEVEYIIARPTKHFTVCAIDRYDLEKGKVYDVNYDDRTSTLSFNVYWESTGRFVKVRIVALSQNRISYTYTFTENQMWFRKGTEPTTQDGVSTTKSGARKERKSSTK